VIARPIRFELGQWLKNTAYDKPYWSDVYTCAMAVDTDGCSGVADWLKWTCWEHDYHYRRHRMIFGRPLTRAEADKIFRVRIQQGSGFGVLSPIAWLRWLGVRLFGGNAWRQNG
jgi:hypothetical protein